MPLLNKKPLDLHRYNKLLDDDAEVFYCKSTNEIFKDYEEYCERVILCNSLVWTCAITGKSNLTYEEALTSEGNALRTIKDFPMELRTPVLYIASMTERSNFNDFVDDVFNFVKDRYFLGESVEASLDGEWVYASVLRVILPTQEEVKAYCQKKGLSSPISSRPYPGSLYKYEVEVLDDEEPEKSEIRELPAEKIRRIKGFYTKDKNRVYLKQFAEQKKDTSLWKIQESILTKYSIRSIDFSRMFAGEPPILENLKKSPESGRLNQSSIKKFLVPRRSASKTPNKTPKMSDKKKLETGQKTVENLQKEYDDTIDRVIQQVRRESMRLEALEDKARKLEELKRKKEEQKAEKERLAKFVREWKRKRDDLECEDLKDFPSPTPVNCRIPNEYFGDAVMIMEFLANFRKELKVKDYFPLGVKFDVVERALVDIEVAGPLSDILQLLLTALFSLQEQEDDEIRTTDYSGSGVVDESDDISMAEAIRLATIAARWSTTYHGTPLSKLSMDSITISEILRLHLLSSGGRAGDQSSKWRYQERGGYTSSDDPSLLLRVKEPHILKFLSVRSVAELPVGDKVKVLTCLMNQILTYAELRDVIEERYEKVRTMKNELKNDQVAEAKREKEMTAQRLKEKRTAKEMGLSIPQETEEERIRGQKEANKKKTEFNKRLSELHNAAMESQILPLGRDRGYRKYWIFMTMGGLFVEDNETLQGSCLPHPTPKKRSEINVEEDTMAYVKKLFEEERNCGSDKENEGDSSLPIASPKKKHLSESNGVPVTVSPLKAVKEEETEEMTLACTADMETCPIHGKRDPKPKWYFYYQESDIEDLINCLNKRGVREQRLRKALIEEKDRIMDKLSQCPVNQLNKHVKYVPKTVQAVTKYTRSCKGYENANLKYPSGTPIQLILEMYIRELILDTEEKIYCGGLGVLKVRNRHAWREAIAMRSYDKQDDSLTWHQYPFKKTNEKVKTEDDQSRPDTPCSVDSTGDHDVLTSKMDQNQTVKDLASAVLQIARSIEGKYLQKPLTHEEKKREKLTAMERWESSLMSSTSFAQVYLHLATLENSIQWQKSALNARCKVCRRGGDAENMLLCDGCDRGFHVYCLKPKLTTIPEGDWFCRSCRPVEKTERRRKRTRKYFADSDKDDDDEDNEPLISVKFAARSCKRRSRRSDDDDDDDESDEPLSKLVKHIKRSSRQDLE